MPAQLLGHGLNAALQAAQARCLQRRGSGAARKSCSQAGEAAHMVKPLPRPRSSVANPWAYGHCAERLSAHLWFACRDSSAWPASGSARAPTGALPRAPRCKCEDKRGAPSNVLRPCWRSRLRNAGQSRVTAAVPLAAALSCSAYVPEQCPPTHTLPTHPTTTWRSCSAGAALTGCGSAKGCAPLKFQYTAR